MMMMMMMLMLSIVCSHTSINPFACLSIYLYLSIYLSISLSSLSLSDCPKVVLLLGLSRRDLHQYRYVLGCVGKAAPSSDVHLGDVVSTMHDFDDEMMIVMMMMR